MSIRNAALIGGVVGGGYLLSKSENPALRSVGQGLMVGGTISGAVRGAPLLINAFTYCIAAIPAAVVGGILAQDYLKEKMGGSTAASYVAGVLVAGVAMAGLGAAVGIITPSPAMVQGFRYGYDVAMDWGRVQDMAMNSACIGASIAMTLKVSKDIVTASWDLLKHAGHALFGKDEPVDWQGKAAELLAQAGVNVPKDSAACWMMGRTFLVRDAGEDSEFRMVPKNEYDRFVEANQKPEMDLVKMDLLSDSLRIRHLTGGTLNMAADGAPSMYHQKVNPQTGEALGGPNLAYHDNGREVTAEQARELRPQVPQGMMPAMG